MEQPVSEAATQSEHATTDADVVTDLHRLHGSSLFDFARHQGLTDEQAADAVQEALLRLWGELRQGSAIQNPLAWTYRITYRLAMDQHRWRRRLAGLLPRLAPRHPAYAGPEASDELAVWAAIDQLPPRQRQALYLHYAADLTFEDVASVLGISASAARTHASRGLATLRERLAIEEMDR